MFSITWDVAKVPVDAKISVGGDDATLKDLLADHRGEGVFGCLDVGLDQPRVLWTFKGGRGRKRFQDILHIGQLSHFTYHQGSIPLFFAVFTTSSFGDAGI